MRTLLLAAGLAEQIRSDLASLKPPLGSRQPCRPRRALISEISDIDDGDTCSDHGTSDSADRFLRPRGG
jgi:hypothetical protein